MPDNESILDNHEREQDCVERQHKKEVFRDDIEPRDLPFYYDSVGIRETFGKGINDGRIKNCD